MKNLMIEILLDALEIVCLVVFVVSLVALGMGMQ